MKTEIGGDGGGGKEKLVWRGVTFVDHAKISLSFGVREEQASEHWLVWCVREREGEGEVISPFFVGV